MASRYQVKAAVYLILRDGDRVLVSRRQNTGWKDGWFSLVAGHVEEGEMAEQAMVREAKEEAGIDVTTDNLRHVYTMHRAGDGDYIDLFFECHEWSGEPYNAEPHKCAELRWVDIKRLPSETLPYIRTVLANYPAGETYSSINHKDS